MQTNGTFFLLLTLFNMIDRYIRVIIHSFFKVTNMACLTQTVLFSLIFNHAFCCLTLPETKPELCSNLLQSNTQQMQRMQNAVPTGNHFRMQDLTEFCNSDSVGDRSNGLCENIQELTPHMPASLAENLTYFCNPDSQRQFRGRPAQILTVEIQPNMNIEGNSLNVSIREATLRGSLFCPIL